VDPLLLRRVCKIPYIRGVEVCWEVGERAKHVHVNARAMAGVVLGHAERER
jgi:hypothetical protein